MTAPSRFASAALAVVVVSAGLPARPAAVEAQSTARTPATVVVRASDKYQAGWLHRLVLGRHYRDVWTEPMTVQVLDLSTFAGGLTPTRTGGGRQTRSLRFDGADGREYSFRSVDKDPSPVLDTLLRETFIDDLVQDGISAAHPLGALVAEPLLEAAGVLHAAPLLRVMPDDPALGPYREEFAGMLGLIEERPDENEGGRTAFGGAERVISSETLTERLTEGPSDRVDARAFLTARLMDVFLGDWDRHRDQWRWASYAEEPPHRWLPVPRDRDQAFSKFDGLATRIVALYMPQFVRFEPAYPSVERLHWNARALDRWFLAELERPVWDSVAAHLRRRLTDDVIDAAVERLPPEILAINAAELAAALRARRDRLGEAAREFYLLLAADVDVHATDAAELVEVDRDEPGRVRVRVRSPAVSSEPWFDRTLHADETQEVRIYLGGGDDRVVVRGDASPVLTLRVVGGPGDDVFDVGGRGRGVRLYDDAGANRAIGAVRIDDRPFAEWVWTEEDRDQPRDWGRKVTPIFWTTYSGDLGLFLGGGGRLERYAFRKRPWASGFDLRGGWAPAQGKGRVEIAGRIHRAASPLFLDVSARWSGLDVINYFGLGNDAPPVSGDAHKVDNRTATLRVAPGVVLGGGLSLSAGLELSWTDTDANEGRYFAELRDSVYGGTDFVSLGAGAGLVWDPLRDSDATANRVRLSIDGTAFPGVLGYVERSFARADTRFSAILASSFYPRIALAVRGGAAMVWGRFPWNQAAFLGGGETLRGWSEQRFAGDASAWLSGELRVRLGRPRVVVPVAMGVFGFSDVGRVWLDGSSPGGWHSGIGGGLWMQPVGLGTMFRGGVGVGDEGTKVYLALGLPY